MGTKNNPGAYDCYANADPDEPMFVLLGRDPFAAELVRAWADSREKAGEDAAKVAEARKCADDLEAWCRNVGKTPRGLLLPDPLKLRMQYVGACALLGRLSGRFQNNADDMDCIRRAMQDCADRYPESLEVVGCGSGGLSLEPKKAGV